MGLRARKYLFAVAALAALTLAGCPKKESPEDVELAAQEARKAAQERKKKVDVFDEFYVDDAKKSPDSAKGKGKTGAPATEPKALAAVGGAQKFSGNGRYVVQVNSTASESGANKMAAKMKGLGYPAYVVTVQNPTPELIGTYFRVRLGGFDSYSDAKAFAESTLGPAGYDYWIDRKANDNVGVQGSGFGSPGGQPQYPAAPQQQYQPAPAPVRAPAPQQGYPPAPSPAQGYQPAPPPAQGYQPAPAPARAPAPQQGYPPAPPAQGYQPAPPPAQGYQPAPPPAQQAAPPPPRPAQPAAQPRPPAQAPSPAQQPTAKPQQPPPPAQAPAPAPAQQPAARPQQQPAPAPTPAAKPQQPADSWGTGNDWGSDDW
jgi:hypothetical protein